MWRQFPRRAWCACFDYWNEVVATAFLSQQRLRGRIPRKSVCPPKRYLTAGKSCNREHLSFLQIKRESNVEETAGRVPVGRTFYCRCCDQFRWLWVSQMLQEWCFNGAYTPRSGVTSSTEGSAARPGYASFPVVNKITYSIPT